MGRKAHQEGHREPGPSARDIEVEITTGVGRAYNSLRTRPALAQELEQAFWNECKAVQLFRKLHIVNAWHSSIEMQ